MSTIIKYKTVGIIISGDYVGDYIKIYLEPEDGSDCCFIYRSPNRDFTGTVFDSWLERPIDIPIYFEENNWVVEWLE